ncbi:MAG: TrmB family transcriptional regulator [Candidatus Hodarchaeales archaeon]
MIEQSKQKSSDKSFSDQLNILTIKAGLSSSQAKVFLELVKSSEASASELCRKTGIKDSRIYHVLNELEYLGLIVVQLSSPKIYTILPLHEGLKNLYNQAEEEFTKRKDAIEELHSQLKPLVNTVKTPTVIAHIIKGKETILQKLKVELYRAQRNVCFRLPNVKILGYFSNSLNDIFKDGIEVNLGVCEKNFPSTDDLVTLIQFELKRVCCDCFFLIIDDKSLISVSNWKTDNPYAIWTSDTSLIKMTSAYS